ncbi:MAG: ABC transporter substrate-binding protein, partial [Oscillospiraceae bacterium]|nr:ABC transporter substrate-binding protein [Oscillospiraceae bacterium]
MKKVFALALAMLMVLSLAVGCGGTGTEGGSEDTGSVYYLNFKPEQDGAWQKLAADYTAKTGVPVTVVTAASGSYETTLGAEIAKDEPPTLFQVNGPNGLKNWVDYCYDLSGSQVAGELTSDSFALKSADGALAGIGYVIESYGIIVNKTLLAQAGYAVEDIASFADLKKVAEDITARKDELGFAAFSSAGMDSSSDWRFKTHLA